MLHNKPIDFYTLSSDAPIYIPSIATFLYNSPKSNPSQPLAPSMVKSLSTYLHNFEKCLLFFTTLICIGQTTSIPVVNHDMMRTFSHHLTFQSIHPPYHVILPNHPSYLLFLSA